MFLTRKVSFIAGIICAASFAPVFFTPGIFALSVLCAQVSRANGVGQAAGFGYAFGFGFFLASLYWICFGVAVYIDQFWWAIPFALFGLPAFLALLIAFQAAIAWQFRKCHIYKYHLYHFFFCLIWIAMEWFISWGFTGFPWCYIGYAFSVSDKMIQASSIFGILGLSFAAVYIGSTLYSKKFLILRLLTGGAICIALFAFGHYRLEQNPTVLSDVKIRIVQPSIPQTAKWDPDIFWGNLDKQIAMSQKPGSPDIILWSEAALTVPYYYAPVHNALMSVFTKEGQVLLSGGVSDNGKQGADYEVYSSLFAIDSAGENLFDYHKSHLVPFGEYMPGRKYIPLKKITHGSIDYTPGTRKTVYLQLFNLSVQPLICYESIFFQEVKISNSDADIVINVTNDAWYGNSSGPYQHFEISRIRCIENGLPMVRSANNGISAIMDPMGRVLAKLELNQVGILDGYIPLKLVLPTIYSEWGKWGVCSWVSLVLILQSMIYSFFFCLVKRRI
ncbi:MAG: apolipoprotein N-acyltransferase [Rickettsiales bacterium]|nr:MAG: apolipoprotein N-acyltransferase [Rickettsiales bacterium]